MSDTAQFLADGRQKIRLPGDNRLLSEFAAELGRALCVADVYTRSGIPFTVDRASKCLAPISRTQLRTLVEEHCVCYSIKSRGQGGDLIDIHRTMTEADAAGVLQSPQFIAQLRPIERINTVRLPVRRKDGSIGLLAEGYDPQSATFTLDSGIVPADIGLRLSRQILDELLAEFPFADDGRSKSVAIAAMLTPFLTGCLPPNSLRPVFMFLGNAEGCGKSLLTKLSTVPVLGAFPSSPLPRDEDEMRKLLVSVIVEGRLVLVLDNVKQHLSSAPLESFCTSQTYGGRVLGMNRTITGENRCAVFITGNGCTVSPDMRRRTLFCELFMEAERAEDRSFRRTLEVQSILDQRQEILSALFTLVWNWHTQMEPDPSRTHTAFPEWAQVVGGVVEAAGYGCPLATPTIAAAADVDGADIRALVEAIAGDGGEADFAGVIRHCQDRGLFARIVGDGADIDRQQRSKLSLLIARYDRRLIGGNRLLIEGKGHNRKYRTLHGTHGTHGFPDLLGDQHSHVTDCQTMQTMQPCVQEGGKAVWPD